MTITVSEREALEVVKRVTSRYAPDQMVIENFRCDVLRILLAIAERAAGEPTYTASEREALELFCAQIHDLMKLHGPGTRYDILAEGLTIVDRLAERAAGEPTQRCVFIRSGGNEWLVGIPGGWKLIPDAGENHG